jgi:flagellar basal-body rod protein FlgB
MSTIHSTVALLERSLDYHNKRHSVIASNIANVQTPGYRPRDVSFSDALSRAGRLTRTHGMHLPVSPDSPTGMPVFDDAAVQPGIDGNAVSMERQMAKMTANSLRYRAIAELISRRIGMLRYAATDGRR